MSILKPLEDIISKLDTRNILYGTISSILRDNNDSIIGYKVQVGSRTFDVYDTSRQAQVDDVVTLKVLKKDYTQLVSISSVVGHKVEISTVNVGINDG